MKKTLQLLFALLAFVGLSASAQIPAQKNGGGSSETSHRTYNRPVAQHSSEKAEQLITGKVKRAAESETYSMQPVVTSVKGLRPAVAPKIEEAVDVPLIYGNVVYSGQGFADGLYELPWNDNMTFKKVFTGPYALGGAVLHDGVYYTHCLDNDGYVDSCVGYDFETGEIVYDTEISRGAISVGMSDYNGVVYGIFCNSRNNGYRLGTCTYGEDGPVVNEIATLPGRGWTAFAIDGNGQGWGVRADYDDGDLYDAALFTIDLATGEIDEVGPCEITSEYATDMAFERRSNRLFWTVALWDGGYLTEIDTTTGEATVIYQFPGAEQVTGLYIPTLPGPDSPAAPTNLAVDFPRGGLNGKITFSVPSVLNGGDAASGSVNYKVTVNGAAAGSGTTTYGSNVSVPTSVPSSGYYDITAVLTNSNGDGPVANLHAYIGYGAPNSPEVSLVRSGDIMSLNWTVPSTTVEGGYIDPSALTFDVKRYPDDVTVATALTSTTFAQILPVPEEGMYAYYYTVTANNSGVVSAPGKSEEIVVGNGWKVPYAYNFDDPYNFQFYTIVDADNDNETWTLTNNYLFLRIPQNEPSNDWVITPGIYLEAGKLYSFEFDARNLSPSSPSRLEVMWGKGVTPDNLTETAMAPTMVTSGVYEHLKGRLIPKESGYFNVGVHSISDPFNFYTYLDNFSVVYAEDVASAPVDLNVEPGANGARHATVTFKAPSKYISGKEISKLDKVVVEMNGNEIYSVGNVLPGANISCSTDVEEDGLYTFTARSYTKEGEDIREGDAASMPMFIGIDYPVKPTGLVMTEPETPGVVRLDWNPVTKDVRDADLPSVVYNVYKIEGNSIVPRGYQLTEPTQTYRMVEEGSQEFIRLGVAAESSRGQGEMALINGFVGDPYSGYFESFANGRLSHNMAINTITGFENAPKWIACDNSMVSGLTAADDDNGFVVMQAEYADEASALMLGKISLDGFDEPTFSFYTFNIGSETKPDENEIDICVRDFATNGSYEKVKTLKVSATGAYEKWNKVVYDLSAYKDKTVEIMVGVTVKNMALTMFDAFKVADKVNKDLSVKLEAPATVKPGEKFHLLALVRNEADVDADAHTVKFIDHNNVVFAKVELESLVCGGVNRVRVPYVLSSVEEAPVGFCAEVIYESDENTDNNVSAPVSVKPEISMFPHPEDLTGEVTGQGVRLQWTAPDTSTIRPKDVTDTFEDATAGDTTYGDWTFVDKDNEPIGGVMNVDIPGVDAGVTKASFLVFDSSLPQFNSSYFSHSGSKYLASFFLWDQVTQKDDWTISPLLSGNAQTISFYARSFLAAYPESMELYYSTGSLDLDDFIRIDSCCDSNVPEEWTRYTADLPQGTKYFAIRSNSNDMFMFFVDDVTYQAGLDFSGLTLEGYNIYRNSEKLNEEPISECQYLDSEARPQDNVYTVTAVYKEGESKGSDNLHVLASGIDQVTAGVSVKTKPGHIIIEGADGREVCVHGIDGTTIVDKRTGNKIDIEVPGGIYLVRVADKTYKIIVK